MSTYLDAICIQYYRGIGPEAQVIAPLGGMNFFVGANNSGKSVVLDAIHRQLPFCNEANRRRRRASEPTGTERYRGLNEGKTRLSVGVSRSRSIDIHRMNGVNGSLSLEALQTLKHVWDELEVEGHAWLEDVDDNQVAKFAAPTTTVDASRWVRDFWWRDLWQGLTGKSGGSLERHWVPDTLANLSRKITPEYPKSELIPAKRTLGPKGEGFTDNSGTGLIDVLAELQNPDFTEREKRETFDQINEFVREVTSNSEAVLEVPSNREHLLVHMDNKVLPLSSLGTGIHEVILIAAFCTIHTECMVCLEEPEIHLHPVLQRKLVRYLMEHTDNQYFIATHSAAFIDTPGANVFRVTNDGVQTYVDPVLVKQDRRQLCDDLGYRASDIVQANAVVWVEGPSDRIYIQHWLKEVAPELVEGVHFTIMFYGGGLVRHLTASDDAVEEFIELRSLNRNSIVVMDSDKAAPQSQLKPAAQRLKDEVDQGEGLVWITAGREMENYVRTDLLQEALKDTHPKLFNKACEVGKHGGKYDHAFYFHRSNPKSPPEDIYKSADKVGVARYVCERPAELDIFDLRDRVVELAGMIRTANGL